MSHQEHGREDHGHHEHPHHHEHPEHHIVIVVNGREKSWSHKTISYDEVVEISGAPLPSGQNPGFTITYHGGPGRHPDGTLIEGRSVEVKDGMVFNVTPTNRS